MSLSTHSALASRGLASTTHPENPESMDIDDQRQISHRVGVVMLRRSNETGELKLSRYKIDNTSLRRNEFSERWDQLDHQAFAAEHLKPFQMKPDTWNFPVRNISFASNKAVVVQMNATTHELEPVVVRKEKVRVGEASWDIANQVSGVKFERQDQNTRELQVIDSGAKYLKRQDSQGRMDWAREDTSVAGRLEQEVELQKQSFVEMFPKQHQARAASYLDDCLGGNDADNKTLLNNLRGSIALAGDNKKIGVLKKFRSNFV